MADKVLDNNQVSIIGVVDSEFTYSHEVFGEGFYMMEVVVSRLSQMSDRIPLLISERVVDVHQNYIGKTVEARGQFRSYNKHDGWKKSADSFCVCQRVSSFWRVRQSTQSQTACTWMDFICKQPL